MQQHNKKDFPTELQHIFHFMCISSNFEVLGSSQYKNFSFTQDYDLNDHFKSNDTSNILEKLYHEFKQKFIEAKMNPDMFITDFKCGEDDKKEPIRWNYDDILKGNKIANGKRYTFVDCILQKTIMKLDLIVFINGSATEITDNYFITIGKHSNFDKNDANKINAIKRLADDYNELIHNKKYFKAIKRLFSIQTIENKSSKKLINLFNSDLGRLYKNISDINTIILLLEQNFKKVPLDKIIDNLQIVKYSMSKIVDYKIDDSNTIDKICKIKSIPQMRQKLETLSKSLNSKLNEYCKKYLVKL